MTETLVFKECQRPYQSLMTRHILLNRYAALFVDMGLGKTAATLAAIDKLMYYDFCVNKTLVIAPLNVAESVWTDEIDKWEDFSHLRVSKILGTEKARLEGLKKKADIYIINVDNVAWLQTLLGSRWFFDFVVVDESSCFKSPDSQRFRALKMVRPYMDRVVILSGTPSPNGLHDLWSQMYLVDEGERLGETITSFRNNYLYPKSVSGYRVDKWDATEDQRKLVYKKISDVAISLREKDYLKLPKLIFQEHKVKLPSAIMKKYNEFEETLVLNMIEEDEGKITAANAAVLTGKLLQFTGGAVYDEDKNYQTIHKAKLDLLTEIIESAAGQPVLIAYQYKHEVERMKKRFGGHLFKKTDVKDWNAGKHKIMYIHPKSGGHGLNLQAGGCILVWFTPTWSLEQFLQMNKRLHRPGQKKPVIVHKLIAVATLDVDVTRAQNTKNRGQEDMLDSVRIKVVKNLFKKYGKQAA